ncbi:rhomboid family intramembrane serine protease [Canibacter sp. lx-45]|uniref:rhomboid family intramembrane serine protease n=1 Tax=Canibacter zhuwentaonis TaxID=2837491 RepID=UPI001BDC8A24|nr:rhomboid family intramembrane serine protease [Canibacter zhuwentaonis]MBT1035833.1 rhomboid family intramembrane serine protease [Canibacter zhuwentaonis]
MVRIPEYGEMADYSDADSCYRHPGRNSFTLCQRCGNTVCNDCQQPRPVGLICPACVAELMPPKVARFQRGARSAVKSLTSSDMPVVTYAIMALCVLVWVGQQLMPQLTGALWYIPWHATSLDFQPWRIVTSVFAHSQGSVMHLLFNMITLWLFGAQLERTLGRRYYGILFLLAGIGGTAAITLIALLDHGLFSTATLGASGAVFGVIGAFIVISYKRKINVTGLLVFLGLNTVIAFLPGMNISWQGHLGGFITGAALMLLCWRAGSSVQRQNSVRPLMYGAVSAVLIAVFVTFYLLF